MQLYIIWTRNSRDINEKCLLREDANYIGVETGKLYSIKEGYHASKLYKAKIKAVDDINKTGMYHLYEGWEYIGVKIEMEGFEQPEVIINPTENFDAKLEYYKKAYNDNLILKTFSGIRIVDFAYGETYEEIENGLLFGER